MFKLVIILFLVVFVALPGSGYTDENIGYPAVDAIEAKVFGGAYPQMDIYERLDRLEMRVFGATTEEPLSDRVERLRFLVPETSLSAAPHQEQLYSEEESYSSFSGAGSLVAILLMILQAFL